LCSINFTQARYYLAAHYAHQWPEDRGVEIAFAGRSNVGKSSAINAITNQNKLAKTSKNPGKTRAIVFFNVTGNIRLVDLPGYGYAQVPKTLRIHWQSFIMDYLCNRQCLQALVIPMDIRHPLTDLDWEMLEYCWQTGLAAHVLLTKADKYKRNKAVNTLNSISSQLRSQPKTTVQLFSALKKTGLAKLEKCLTDFTIPY